MFSRLFRVISLLAVLCVCGHAAEDKLFNMNTDMEKLIAETKAEEAAEKGGYSPYGKPVGK